MIRMQSKAECVCKYALNLCKQGSRQGMCAWGGGQGATAASGAADEPGMACHRSVVS